MVAHTKSHMSPAQAAQVAGVSRWAIMRAIKSHDLKASRDNRNQWRIAAEALDAWRSHSVRTPDTLHIPHISEEVADLRAQLAAANARAEAAEADRERWRVMAEKLAQRPRLSWWPWGR